MSFVTVHWKELYSKSQGAAPDPVGFSWIIPPLRLVATVFIP